MNIWCQKYWNDLTSWRGLSAQEGGGANGRDVRNRAAEFIGQRWRLVLAAFAIHLSYQHFHENVRA